LYNLSLVDVLAGCFECVEFEDFELFFSLTAFKLLESAIFSPALFKTQRFCPISYLPFLEA